MSHWFHRNGLKSTTLVSYDFLSGTYNLTKLSSDLKRVRDRLLDLLPDPGHNMDTVNTAFISYLSMMSGFFLDLKLSEQKLRYVFTFKWTHTLLGQTPQPQQDVAFDVANMCVNVGLWFMKHSSYLSSKKVVTMEDAKELHTCLKRAAGIFQMVERDIIPMTEPPFPESDLDHRILGAYFHQCVAEAEEVTIARAIKLEHNDNLISALANETSKMFENAQNHLRGVRKEIAEQWYTYLEIKKNIYLAYAYCYAGKKLLGEDLCGEAIKSLRESQIHYNRSLNLCKIYAKAKGPVKPVKPDGHIFFNKINATVSSLLEKCERENGFIYHQKIPDNVKELERKPAYGLASPETYGLPAPAPIWEAAFQNPSQLSSIKVDPPKQDTKKKEKELPPVKERVYTEDMISPSEEQNCFVQ